MPRSPSSYHDAKISTLWFLCLTTSKLDNLTWSLMKKTVVSSVILFPLFPQRQPNQTASSPASSSPFKYDLRRPNPTPEILPLPLRRPNPTQNSPNFQRERERERERNLNQERQEREKKIGRSIKKKKMALPEPEPEPEPEAERQAPILLPPPGDVPPPHTEAGLVLLLDILRRRVRGAPTWMLPRYLVHDVDLYRYHPQVLLRLNPSATSPDGKRACYFLNLVRPLSATDSRRSRVVPGGFWKSERAPVPVEAAPDRIVGSKQTFSFVSKGGEDKDGLRAGFIMQELVLPGQAGRLAGGDELALSRVYPTPRINKKTPQGQRSTSSARSSAPASSPPAAPDLLHRRPVSAPSSSPPPLWQAPASSLALHGTASSASGPSPSSQPPIQGQGGARRVLLLEVEVGDSPPREGKTLSFQRVYQATELVGPGKRVSIDCGDMFLLDTGNGKRQRTAAAF